MYPDIHVVQSQNQGLKSKILVINRLLNVFINIIKSHSNTVGHESNEKTFKNGFNIQRFSIKAMLYML